jgi:catechol 2,3-dioxygenase-like lactoylglutathione lyase family enzyme
MSVLGVELETADVKALRDFYVNRLRFTLLEETANQLKLQVGYTKLVFSQAASGAQPRYRFSVGVLAQRFTEVAEGLGRRTTLIARQGQTVFSNPARKVGDPHSDPAAIRSSLLGMSTTDGRLLG